MYNYVYIYTRVCIYMVRQLWIPNAAEPQVDTDVQMPGALRLNRTAFEATLILLHPRVNRCPSCRRSWMRMSPWDTMRFILSVQQNDQIATIHMGVVDVVTCCYGCRVQTVFFMGRFLRIVPLRSGHTQVRKQRLAGRTGNMTEDKAHGIPDEQLKTKVTTRNGGLKHLKHLKRLKRLKRLKLKLISVWPQPAVADGFVTGDWEIRRATHL